MRLIRTILLLAGAGFLLPAPPETAATADQQQASAVSTFAVISSASSTFADVASFCVRQPGVCETAGYVAGRLEAKAKYSARLIYEWANDATADPGVPEGKQEAIKVDMMKTGALQVAQNLPAQPQKPQSQSTLKIEDLIPEWRGPVSAKKKQG